MLLPALLQQLESLHLPGLATLDVSKIPFEPAFREACRSNTCGMYDHCWTCPPHIGEIHELIAKAKGYQTAVVYQTIHTLEDSYDIEGMLEGGACHNQLAQSINQWLLQHQSQGWLHLGAGGCHVCERCAKRDDLPCRFPDRAMASLEAYGIAVSELAKRCQLNYINGQNTVTYFGAILLK